MNDSPADMQLNSDHCDSNSSTGAKLKHCLDYNVPLPCLFPSIDPGCRKCMHVFT